MSYKSQFKNYGLGLGLRRSLKEKTLNYIQEKADDSHIKWLEIVPENHIVRGGIHKKSFQDVLDSGIQLIPHGVNLSIATASDTAGKPSFDRFLIDELKELFQVVKPPWFSDHISCTRINGFYLQDLIPSPRTQEAVDVITTNIKFLEDEFQLPFLIENPSFYTTLIEPEMSELDFINQILNKADCGMLLDVNNVYVNSINHNDYQPADFIRGLDLDRVVQVHIAGHLEDYTAWLTGEKLKVLDTHGENIRKEVFDILEDLLSLTEIKAILLERDSNFPDFDGMIEELDEIAKIMEREKCHS